MKCPKCGFENKDYYCLKCGAMVTDDGVKQINLEYKRDINDDIKDILDSKYNHIFCKPTNWAAAFFGPFYLLYRKCYVEGTLLLLLMLVHLILIWPVLNIIVITYAVVPYFIFFFSFTNPYYIYKLKRYMKKGVPYEKLGKTSFLGVILILSIIVLMYLLTII